MGVNDSKDRYEEFAKRVTALAINKELERVRLILFMQTGLPTANYPYIPTN